MTDRFVEMCEGVASQHTYALATPPWQDLNLTHITHYAGGRLEDLPQIHQLNEGAKTITYRESYLMQEPEHCQKPAPNDHEVHLPT